MTYRAVPDSHPSSAVRFFLIAMIQGVALAIALSVSSAWFVRTVIYAVIAFVPTLAAARAARAHWVAQ
jgi:hypothetical protein